MSGGPAGGDGRAALAGYLREIVAHAGWRLPGVLLLMLLSAAASGFGVLLLLPLLASLGIGNAGNAAAGVTRTIAGALERVGVGESLPGLLLVVLLVVTLQSALRRGTELLTTRLRLEFVDALRVRLYAAVQRAEWRHLVDQRSSDYAELLASGIGRLGWGTDCVLGLATSAILGLAYTLVAAALSPVMTALALGIGAVLLVGLGPRVGETTALGDSLVRSSRAVLSTLSEYLAAMKLAKSHAAEERHIARFTADVAALRRDQLDFVRVGATARMQFRILAAALLCLFVYVAVSWVQVPSAELIVLVTVFVRVTPLFSELQESYRQALHMLPTYAAIRSTLARCDSAAEPVADGVEPIPRPSREIRLSNVGFRYRSGPQRAALDAVSVVVPIDRATAIAGASGAGKSTLADVLLGLLAPTTGEVRVDGRVLAGTTRLAWRRCVAYVPQDTFLFHDTIRENLRWVRAGADEPSLWRALDAAGAGDFVRGLADGLDTVVGDRGMRFSGGERQRIALARALLAEPALLVLDEATSAVDSAQEADIGVTLRALRGKLTLVVIAHRSSTVREADHVIVLKEGRVLGSGSRDALDAEAASEFERLRDHRI